MQDQKQCAPNHDLDCDRVLSASEPHDFLQLCATQLADAVGEANTGARQLVDAALAMSAQSRRDASASHTGDVGAEASFEAVRQSAESIAVGLQWLDRFHQRLSHVQSHLLALAAVLPSDVGLTASAEWQAFLEDARRIYTTEAERRHFDFQYRDLQTTDVDAEDAADIVLF